MTEPMTPKRLEWETGDFSDDRVAESIFGTYYTDRVSAWIPGEGSQKVKGLTKAMQICQADYDRRWREGGEVRVCEWAYDEGMDAWESSCGEHWMFTNDGPRENNVRFCQGCGGKTKIKED